MRHDSLTDLLPHDPGQPLWLAVEILDARAPSPCIDLDGDGSTCEVEVGNFALLIDAGSTPVPLVLPSAGLELLLPVPANPGLWGAPFDSFRFQSAIVNPASPIGLGTSNRVDHRIAELSYAGPTGDDSSVEIPLEAGFTLYGVSQTSLHLNSNGNLTFGAADLDFSPTVAELLADEPRIAPLWTDLAPNNGGAITAQVVRGPGGELDSIDVTFEDVVPFGASTDSSFGVTLFANGSIAMRWDAIGTPAEAIAGLSPGGDLSTADEIDLASNALLWSAPQQALYESFANDGTCEESPADLQGFATLFVPGLDASGAHDGSYAVLSTGSVPKVVTALTPDAGPEDGGQIVTLSGSRFDPNGSYAVDFDGQPASGVSVLDSCTLECTTPAGTVGLVDVTITEAGGFSQTLAAGYEYQPAGTVSGSFTLSDDGSANYTFASGGFTFHGVGYSDVWVNANGNLTIGAASADFTESSIEMLDDEPRIAMAWDDHNPALGGSIDYVETTSSFSVTYSNITAYSSGDNSYTVTLDKSTGTISVSYGTCTSWNGASSLRSVLVGTSAGGSLGSNTMIDVSAPGSVLAAAPTDALFEYLNSGGNAWALDGQAITFTPQGGNGSGPYLFSNP